MWPAALSFPAGINKASITIDPHLRGDATKVKLASSFRRYRTNWTFLDYFRKNPFLSKNAFIWGLKTFPINSAICRVQVSSLRLLLRFRK